MLYWEGGGEQHCICRIQGNFNVTALIFRGENVFVQVDIYIQASNDLE